MSPLSRGIVQRMTEVALEMWGSVAGLFVDRATAGVDLAEDDEELDILHNRLTAEVALARCRPTSPARSPCSPASTSASATTR